MISSWRRSNLLRGANTTNSTMTSVSSIPLMNLQHTSAAVMWLTLENIVVQVETHLNPTYLHTPLVVVSHHGKILDISQEAMSLIGMTDKTVEEMSKIPGIVIVKAASWNGKNNDTDDTDPLQAYRIAVENGPFSLLKGMLKGQGYTLSQEEGGASESIGEAFVNITHTEVDDDDEGQHAYQIARELGASLQMELANHMHYAMIYGVGYDLQSAKLDAMRGSKGEEAGSAEPTAGSKADDQHKMEAAALQRRQVGDWGFEEDRALGDDWEADVAVVGHIGGNDYENDGDNSGGANGQQDPALHADQQHQHQREEEEEGIQEEGHVCDVCKAVFWEPSALSIHIEAMHSNHAHPSPSRKQPRASLSSSIPSSNERPSTQLASSSFHQNATRTRRQKGATSPSFSSPSSVAKAMAQLLQGPGQHSITDALGALTSSQDIAVYLKEIGAPRVNLKLWKEAGRERREEEGKHISSCTATSSTPITARRSADSSPPSPPPPALPPLAPPAVSPPAALSISRGVEGQRTRWNNITSSSIPSFLPIFSTDDSSNEVILVASAAGAAPLYPHSVPAIGGHLLPLQGNESAAVDDGTSLKSTRRQERAAAREAKRKRKREAKQQDLAHDRITVMNRAIDVN